MSTIPTQVKDAASHLTRYDGAIELLGTYKQKDVFIYKFLEAVTIGFPEVYLWDGRRCQVVFGEEAFKVINTLL